ncbi:HAD family hydrolase [Arthrobacter sp. FW305-BF8]|uniref:HAD family hydrolase n=1 Tax=Arthrobacter sp. FW305-BF8 TaxID=2879617 RepID=UPI001F2F1B97|nr:HAD family hydrolase [Arthrobacter sp. FW305-BF8]UKA53753.1 HAD family hydrolase [Arthrobacter sp. FW305-BF8]
MSESKESQNQLSPGKRREKGVLFDVDGTLIDSAYIHTLAWWQAFRQSGFDVPMARIHRCVGMGGARLVDSLLPDSRNKDVDETILSAHSGVFGTYWPSLRPLDGARDLLAKCNENGLAVALASSAREQDLEALRSALSADDYIDAATSSNDAENSKPEPDILVAALEAVGLDASGAVYVGDAVWDVMAASKLGIPTIALTCGGTSEAELREAGAVEVYDGPRQLLDNLGGSAIGRLLAG